MGDGATDDRQVLAWKRECKERAKLRKREMRVLADELEAGRRRLRLEDMALVLIALRNYKP